jgi:hypothetical protein
VIALATLLFTDAAGASSSQEKRLHVTPFGGWTVFDNELKASTGLALEDHAYFGGRIGLRLVSLLWLELAGGYTPTTSNDYFDAWKHLSANLMFASSNRHAVQPFLSLGGGISTFAPRWSPDETEGTFEAAAGVKVKITDAIGLRLEARDVLLVPRKNYDRAHLDNIIAGAGLVFAFGGKGSDSDRDGVPDKQDLCPDTPRACAVDARGCPIDTDGDGVCDGVDACLNSTRGSAVDARGCPIDTDRDGVIDSLDSCTTTARGCWVDARGCPFDADGDGVCDGLDKCPDSPSGARVDSIGCPISKVLIPWPPLNFELNKHRDSRGSAACNFYINRRNET